VSFCHRDRSIVVGGGRFDRSMMPDRMLQNHNCVAGLQQRLSYTATMRLPTNHKNGGPIDRDLDLLNGGLLRAGALAVAAALALLAAGCGGSGPSSPTGSASTALASFREQLAFAHCMRAHGLRGFPDPNSSGGPRVRLNGNPNSPAARANDACKQLLTAGSTGKGVDTAPAPSPLGGVSDDCLASRPACYTPRQLRVAYGIQPLLDRGITGRGQTVVLPEFPPSTPGSQSAATRVQVPAVTDIRKDLARFDAVFGLPAARLQVVNTLARSSSPWLASPEEVGDTEIVHALAPDATIREILIASPYTASLGRVSAALVAALRRGLAEGGVISLSAGTGEQSFTPAELAEVNSVLRAAQRDRVTVVVSTGDSGAATTACLSDPGSAAVKGVDLPASDPLALAVGGTSLQARQETGAYIGETTWNIPHSAGEPMAGGGGLSRLFPRPGYQDGIAVIGATRGVPDVAADADHRPGIAIAFSGGGKDYTLPGGGVSAAAPLWAAVIALANQYAGRDLGFVNPGLYRIGHSAHYHQAFHDVTTGTNTVQFNTQAITGYLAAPGWDPVTGWGSPNAQVLVPLLARDASQRRS
jgi:subtilase family serine protease